jgi:homospermidine synthase
VSCLERLVNEGASAFTEFRVLTEDEIYSGYDELGVLLYGHNKNAYWYGSRLSTEDTRSLAPNQNATGLQVTSAVLAGIYWMLDNPRRGIVEAEEMDHEYCLAIQEPYLGSVFGEYTNWRPASTTENATDAWQFSNIRMA